MARLLSVNVGLPREVEWKGKNRAHGLWTSAVAGRRKVMKLNVDGDGQGDLVGHGGVNRAIMVYSCYRVGIRINESRMPALQRFSRCDRRIRPQASRLAQWQLMLFLKSLCISFRQAIWTSISWYFFRASRAHRAEAGAFLRKP